MTQVTPDSYDALVAAHALAARLYEQAYVDLRAHASMSRRERYEQACTDLYYFTARLVLVAAPGTPVETVDGPLVVVGTVDGVTTLSEDGGPVDGRWHDRKVDGAFAEDAVRYERYTDRGRTGHGFADKVSRKIVQTG